MCQRFLKLDFGFNLLKFDFLFLSWIFRFFRLAIILLGPFHFLQVWAIADLKRQGYLGHKEFITAMQVLNVIVCCAS